MVEASYTPEENIAGWMCCMNPLGRCLDRAFPEYRSWKDGGTLFVELYVKQGEAGKQAAVGNKLASTMKKNFAETLNKFLPKKQGWRRRGETSVALDPNDEKDIDTVSAEADEEHGGMTFTFEIYGNQERRVDLLTDLVLSDKFRHKLHKTVLGEAHSKDDAAKLSKSVMVKRAESRTSETSMFVDHFEKAFEGYKGQMETMIMMATLMVGFSVTGTCLSINLTGGENYAYRNAKLFGTQMAASAWFSALATVSAFAIYTEARQRHSLQGAAHGLRFMRRVGSFFLVFSEFCMYVSIILFILNIEMYVTMHYRGPDICTKGISDVDAVNIPGTVSVEVIRKNSFCGILGQDMHDTAAQVCGNDRSLHEIPGFSLVKLCEAYEGDQFPEEVDFVWDAGKVIGTAFTEEDEFFELLDEASNAYCRLATASSLRDSMCAPPGQVTSLDQKLACSSAMRNFMAADDCSGKMTDDLLKCQKVCHGDKFSSWVGWGLSVNAPIIIFALYRVIRSYQFVIGHFEIREYENCRRICCNPKREAADDD